MRIVVTGHMVRHPVAGNIMAFMSYLIGLCRIGQHVVYIEESGWEGSCYDPHTGAMGDDPGVGLSLTTSIARSAGLDVSILYVNRRSGEVHGGSWEDVKTALAHADILLNLGGVCWLPEFKLARLLVMVDMDPLFTQLGRFGLGATDEHQLHFSYGVNIGQPGCTVPTAGIDWIPTVPPVVTDLWPIRPTAENAHFTTIANWSAYSTVERDGIRYGQKDEEFLRFIDVPSRTNQVLEIAAAGIPGSAKSALTDRGWRLTSAADVTHDFNRYRDYIGSSRGEFTVAKNAYVKTRSGWFSDRSVCYLASGLPVIIQDTGFSDWLDTGEGVLAYSTIDEAVSCLESTVNDCERHRVAARAFAEDVFAAEKVLDKLLRKAVEGRFAAASL
jgi:hypothetical protein